MSTNHDPCAGHECDHCWICDGLGVCCADVPNLKRLFEAKHFDFPPVSRADVLMAAINHDVQAGMTRLSMLQRVALDAELVLVSDAEDPYEHPTHHDLCGAHRGEPLQLPAGSEPLRFSDVGENVKQKGGR